MPGTAAMTIHVFPVSPRTARDVAHQLRCAGFWSLAPRTWGHVADLAELLAEAPPTAVQIAWLRAAHQKYLIER
jgi:esterase/lipase